MNAHPHGPSYGGPPPPRAAVPGWVWILLALAGFGAFGTCATCVYRAATSEEPSGVVYASQVPDETRARLDALGVLEGNEQLLVYYDGTVSLDQSELALLTTERVISVKGRHRASARLADITAIEHRDEALLGDVIEVTTSSGPRLRLEIAPLNGGVTFLNALEDQAKERAPGVRVRRAAPR